MARTIPPAERIENRLNELDDLARVAAADASTGGLDAEARRADEEADEAREALAAAGRSGTAGVTGSFASRIVRPRGVEGAPPPPDLATLKAKVAAAVQRAKEARAAAAEQRAARGQILDAAKREARRDPVIRAAVADAVEALLVPLRDLARAQLGIRSIENLLDAHELSLLAFDVPHVPLSPDRADGSDGLSHLGRIEKWLADFRAARGL